MCESLDQVRLSFSPESLIFLDLTLALIMFGVALSLKISDFSDLLKQPRPALFGLASQFILLPMLTLGLVWVFRPCPSMALGMFLVAACPGGNISNFISQLARGNIALSVSLSAVSTSLSLFMTPANFAFWASLYPPAAEMLAAINLDPFQIFTKIFLTLGLPLILGMLTAAYLPKLTARLVRPMRILSIVIFFGYVVAALGNNFQAFLDNIQYIIVYVFIHNLVALLGGYTFAYLGGIAQAERKTIAIETGIQNSGLALVLIFSPIFDSLGGMAMIAALWGIWHIISGLALASIWSGKRAFA